MGQLARPETHGCASSPPVIVVVAYNRPSALSRLLGSLQRLRLPVGIEVPLIISVDDSVADTVDVARKTAWSFGEKKVIARPMRLGLRDHVLACGDLSAEFGSIMMLEDDLYVSPDAYRFACFGAAFYASDERIAGISLYAYRLDEYQRLAFHPLDDGFDTFFMQMPSSWGQLWTAEQWSEFRKWHQSSRRVLLPAKAARWSSEKSWKRSFLAYLIDTDRYFVFPRQSLTSNCGDAGEHFRQATINLTSPLTVGPREWRFAPWESGSIRYDAWFEPHVQTVSAIWPDFVDPHVTIDLRASKQPSQVKSNALLSSRPCSQPDVSFPMLLQPEVLNLNLPGQGKFFHLAPSSAFGEMPPTKRRRMMEALNGEISHELAGGILLDRLARRLRRSRTDWRTE